MNQTPSWHEAAKRLVAESKERDDHSLANFKDFSKSEHLRVHIIETEDLLDEFAKYAHRPNHDKRMEEAFREHAAMLRLELMRRITIWRAKL